LMLTAYNSAETAVKAIRLGALDYLTKPFEVEELVMNIRNAVETVSLRQRLEQQQAALEAIQSFGDLVATDDRMRRVFEIARKAAQAPTARILITGESGTGKGQLAKAIHAASPNRAENFIDRNCAAIPGELLESELFGYEKGAFTDASQKKLGLLSLVNGGTLFLDEIGDMPALLQSKVLKVIEEKEFTPLGGVRAQKVEFRLLTATNKNLDVEVKAGRFREDLLYRINVITIEMPPLRDRVEDIIPLAHHFIRLFNAELSRGYTGLAPDVVRAYRAYPWPGNVRELRNTIERVMILEDSEIIRLEYLPENLQKYAGPHGLGTSAGAATSVAPGLSAGAVTMFPSLDSLEKAHILRALELTNQNVSRAADLLGISRHTVLRKLERYGRAPREGDAED
ncbi:MAG: sigma-54 dependent transcriptional regulator, partial [bacterium]